MGNTLTRENFSNMAVGSYSNVYTYATSDTLATTTTQLTEFNSASAPGLKVGDIIFAWNTNGDSASQLCILGVTGISSAGATVVKARTAVT